MFRKWKKKRVKLKMFCAHSLSALRAKSFAPISLTTWLKLFNCFCLFAKLGRAREREWPSIRYCLVFWCTSMCVRVDSGCETTMRDNLRSIATRTSDEHKIRLARGVWVFRQWTEIDDGLVVVVAVVALLSIVNCKICGRVYTYKIRKRLSI